MATSSRLNEHAAWGRFRFYDFIFPLFIFVTGVSIVLALPRLVERDGKARTHLHVLRRALLLYALGVIFYGGVAQHWSDIRYVGVLQRIAICYLFASLLFLNLDKRGLIVALVALLGGYWALMALVPVRASALVRSHPTPIWQTGSMQIICPDGCGTRHAIRKGF